MSKLHIAIAGAGLGGLVLAQALKSKSIGFDVFESDPALDARPQGYRLRIDAQGQRALARTLPSALYALLRETASISSTAAHFLTPELTPVAGRAPDSWHAGETGKDEEMQIQDMSVDRRILREILMCGIEDRVHFGRAFEHYRVTDDGRVLAGFGPADPTVACDVLVGADGVNSRVRAALAPAAAPIETGALCFYGKADLARLGENVAALTGTRVIFASGFAAVLEQMSFASAPWAALARACAGRSVTPADDYLYWCLIGPASRFDLSSSGRPQAHAIRAMLLTLTDGWHPALQCVLRQSDAGDIAMLPVRNGRPDMPWPAGPVTLLGDAIHAMSPAGGLGANMALCDAAALADAITMAGDAGASVSRALADYEAAMRARAALALESSSRGAARLFAVA